MREWIDICYALGREEIRVNQSGISSEHTFIGEFKIFLTRLLHGSPGKKHICSVSSHRQISIQ